MSSEESGSLSSDNLPKIIKTLDNNKELNNNQYIKELLSKIEVLKKGIIEGRKKNTALSAQNKQLETEVNAKENEIRKLCKEKIELENQLQLEKKKLAKKEESFLQMANAFSKSPCITNTSNNTNIANITNITNKLGLIKNFLKKNEDKTKDNENNMFNFINNNEKIDKLSAENDKLKLENENFNKKYNDISTQNENLKNEFKSLIKIQSEKLYKAEEENKKLKIENQNAQESNTKLKMENRKLINELDLKNNIIKEDNEKKNYLEKIIRDLEESKNNLIIQLQRSINKCEKLVLENQTNREKIHQHQIDEDILTKIAEYKNDLIKINTKVQIFQVLKIGLISNSRMDITFGQDKDNNYVMRIDDDSKKVELINMLDVEYFKKIGKDKVEISYMHKSRKKSFTVIVEETNIDKFMDAYKNFFIEAKENEMKENEIKENEMTE